MGTSTSAILDVSTLAYGVAPGAATNLAVTAATTTTLPASWTAPTTGDTPFSYQPQFRANGTTSWLNFGPTILATSVVISGLAPATLYDIQIISENSYGQTPSATLTTSTATAAPTAPTAITATAASTSSVTVGWTQGGGSSPQTFTVSYRTPPGSGAWTPFSPTTSTPATSLTVTGLAQATQYEFEVGAANAGGSATSATTATATTPSTGTLPGAPTNLTTGSITTTSVQVDWSPPASGTTPFTYTVQWSPTGQNSWATAGTVSDPTVTLAVTGLATGTTYDFRVQASNAAGAGPWSATLTATTTSSGPIREPWNQPGSASSMWNMPFGSGAVWSGPNDADTLSLRKANTVNAASYGAPVYVGQATDPLVTFAVSATTGEIMRDQHLSATVHCPASAQPAPPFPGGDCQMTLFDVTQPTQMWCFGGCTFNNGTDVTGGVTSSDGETDLVCGVMEDAVTGNYGYNQGMGVIRAWELDSTQNPSGLLQHGLRFACDQSQLLPPPTWDTTTFPDGSVAIYWPQTHVDYNGPTAYYGNMPGGATIGIPASVPMPSGLSAGGQMLWINAQTYGWHWRDTATGGVTLYTEPSMENNALIAGMRGDLPTIVANLCVLRNQGPNSVQGGGTPVAAGPPVIDPSICGTPVAPGQVTGLAVASLTGNSVSLTWTLPAGSLPLSLVMQWSPHGAGTWTNVSAGANATSGTVTGLSASTAYDFQVYATNSSGTGAVSSIVSATTSSSAPASVWSATLSSPSVAISNGGLTATAGTLASGASQQSALSNTSQSSGKWFFEVETVGTPDAGWATGICNTTFPTYDGLGADGNGVGFYPGYTLQCYWNNTFQYGGSTNDAAGDVISVAVDLTAQLIWFTSPAMRTAFGSGAWNDSGTASPASGTGGVSFSGFTGPAHIAWNAQSAGSAIINDGSATFSISPPTGFTPWNGGSGGGGGGAIAPGQVTGLAVSTTASNSITLTWSQPTTGTQPFTYTLQVSPHGAGTWTTAATGSSTTLSAGGLNPSTSYDFRAFATNAAGNGTDSATVTATTTAASTTGPLMLTAGPLFVGTGANASQIVDGNGTPQRIAGVGWSGGYYNPPTLEGLDSTAWRDCLDTIVRCGFNTIRLHTADVWVLNNTPLSAIDTNLNSDLVGVGILDVYVMIMQYCAGNGLRVIVDSHCNEGGPGQQGNGLWYDSGGISNGTDGSGNTGTITDALWIQAWQTKATKFKGQAALLGYDLRNEPLAYSGMCTWGDGNVNSDLMDAYQRAGNAIQAIDATPLIFCEGPQNYNNNFLGGIGAPEGDLTLVPTHPVVLTTSRKVVYSVHAYPSTVGGTYPGGQSGSGAISRWNTNFGFLISQNIAPLWVGECGTRLIPTADQQWAQTFVPYCNGTVSGAPTYSGTQQGIGTSWWVFAVSENPGGVGGDFGVTTAFSGGVLQSQEAPYLTPLEFTAAGSTGQPPLIVSPLTGTITTGTWQLSTINGMYYWYLLPYGYTGPDPQGSQANGSAAASYPLVLYLHQLDQANPFYQNGNNPANDLVQPQIDPWFNNTTFRTNQPCIVVAPLLNQLADTTGNTINFGGVTTADQPGEDNAISLVQYFMQAYPVYPHKVYVTGNSMGGIGSWDIIIKYNTKNPLTTPIFAATLILAGADYCFNYPNPTSTMISNMAPVPIWSIHGSQDTQVPLAWDQNMYAAMSAPAPGGGAVTPADLIAYFNSIAGTYTVSGQFIELGPLTPIQNIDASTGYWLGMIGGDYWHFGGTGPAVSGYPFNANAISYWQNSGLVTLICSMPNPTTGGYSGDTSGLDAAGLLTSGTATNNALMSMLDDIATGLQQLQSNGVVVIFRPYHEANGNWFWWGTGLLSGSQFIALWQFTWDYFTNTKGLTNLVWLFGMNAGLSSNFPISGIYPGSSYVDMMGIDLYTDNPGSAAGDYSYLLGYSKPVCLSEFGSGSPSAGDTSFQETTLISTIANQMPNVVFWQQWWDGNNNNPGWGMAECQNVAAALAESRVLNRGDLTVFSSSSSSKTVGLMQFTEPNLGHDVWDTYYVEPTSNAYWSWLFNQNA